MPKTTVATNLVGRKVTCDFPVRWKNCLPQYRESMKAECQAKEPLFGKKGEIVAVYQDEEKCLKFSILIEGQLHDLYDHAFTVEPGLPPMEMRLCETTNVILKPNQPYIFTADPSCNRCMELARLGAPPVA